MDRGRGRTGLGLVAPGLLGFWSLYFAIVALSNLADLLAHGGWLPAGWRWVSGNLAFIDASTKKFGIPGWVPPLLLGGVVAWQAVAAGLFWRAAREPADRRLGPAFVAGLGLWATFILLDELLLIFETGAEATHLRLLVAQLLTLAVIRLEGLAADTRRA